MASLKKVQKMNQKTHRERGQLSDRLHLGELEKKKDYKIRARAYQEKRDRIKYLHKKALERNPDEFYFHMVNSKVEDGRHREKPKEENTLEQNLLMQNQDLRYINFRLQMEKKVYIMWSKLEKLQASRQIVTRKKQMNKHTVFVADEEEEKSFDPATYLNTHPALLARSYNRPKLETLETWNAEGLTKKELKKVQSGRRKAGEEIKKRRKRAKELRIASRKMEVKMAIAAGKGDELKPKKIKKGKPRRAAIYQWPTERKK